MGKSTTKNSKDIIEEPLLDKNVESLKKLISKGKKDFYLEMNAKKLWKMKSLTIRKNFILK